MKKTGPRNLPQYAAGISGKTLGQLGPIFPLERSAGIEIIGTVENPAHHVPFGESQ